jgi:hypothetical protein
MWKVGQVTKQTLAKGESIKINGQTYTRTNYGNIICPDNTSILTRIFTYVSVHFITLKDNKNDKNEVSFCVISGQPCAIEQLSDTNQPFGLYVIDEVCNLSYANYREVIVKENIFVIYDSPYGMGMFSLKKDVDGITRAYSCFLNSNQKNYMHIYEEGNFMFAQKRNERGHDVIDIDNTDNFYKSHPTDFRYWYNPAGRYGSKFGIVECFNNMLYDSSKALVKPFSEEVDCKVDFCVEDEYQYREFAYILTNNCTKLFVYDRRKKSTYGPYDVAINFGTQVQNQCSSK